MRLRHGRSVLVCPRSSAHGISSSAIYPWTVCRLLDRVYWPGLHEDVRSYLASCSVCLAPKSPCPSRAPMGRVSVGHRWDRVAMDILDKSVTTERGNRYVLVIVDCFSRWTKACPLPNKTAVAIVNAFFQLIICRFGMPGSRI